MALNLIAPEIAVPIQVGVGAARAAVGETTYQAARGTGTWSYSLLQGFVPILQPMFILPQIGLFIFMIIFFIIFFGIVGISRWWSIPAAYFAQAFITAFLVHKVLDIGLNVALNL
jgi:hypothetical protein